MDRPIIGAGSKVLVTGAGGFVGTAVCEALSAAGYRVRAMVRTHTTFKPDIDTYIGDITNEQHVQEAVAGVTAVVHLAARKADEKDSEAVNVGGARLLASACKQAGVSVIINVSTQSAKLRHAGLYGRTKLASEEVLRLSGLPVIILRPSVVYGDEGGGILSAILAFCALPIIPIIGDGKVGFMPIHRDDLAAIIVQSLTKGDPATTYDVGGPDRLTLRAFTNEMQRKMGIRKTVVPIPIPIAMLIAILTSWMPRPPVTRSNVRGGAEDVPMDIEPMLKDFGVIPRGFTSGLDAIFRHRNHRMLHDEAWALLRYVLSYTPSDHDITLYLAACQAHDAAHALPTWIVRHRMMLGGLDAVKRRGSLLEKKLLIAAAVAECSPQTAMQTLPRDQSIVAILRLGVIYTLRSIIKYLIGLPLLLIPSLSRHAR